VFAMTMTMTMTQRLQSFGEILYFELHEARTRRERLEIARKMLLGGADGITWLVHFLSESAAPHKAMLRLFRKLHPDVESQVRELAEVVGGSHREVMVLAVSEMDRARCCRVNPRLELGWKGCAA
jgi:hypothetical protein